MTENCIPRRPTASRLAPKRIYKPRRGPNDISVLSKSCYGRSLSRDKAVIWRMSAKGANIPAIAKAPAPRRGVKAPRQACRRIVPDGPQD